LAGPRSNGGHNLRIRLHRCDGRVFMGTKPVRTARLSHGFRYLRLNSKFVLSVQYRPSRRFAVALRDRYPTVFTSSLRGSDTYWPDWMDGIVSNARRGVRHVEASSRSLRAAPLTTSLVYRQLSPQNPRSISYGPGMPVS